MSARFTGTPSLSPRHVCQIYGHTKLVPPACLPDSWAPQDCPLHKTAGFPGTLRLSPARNCRFTGHLNLVPRTKLPVSRAPQDCPPHETASLPGILSLLRSFSWGFGPRDALFDAAGWGARLAKPARSGSSVWPPPQSEGSSTHSRSKSRCARHPWAA